MNRFVYTGLPARVVFGPGTLSNLAEEAALLGITRAFVVSTREQSAEGRRACTLLGERVAGLYSGAVMHTPTSVTEIALKQYQEMGADGLVAIGGGSTIGLAKAIALRTDAPQIAIPTTYAGSEMTPILGQTESGQKTTQRSVAVLPETVIYDVELTVSLPSKLSVTSGLNAIAHAVEALYAENANPVLSLMAIEGIGALARALPRIVSSTNDMEARSDAQYGAWLCAICLGSAGVALHHKLCHVLGGTFDLPHAETHAVVLPHALAYNAPAVSEVMHRLAGTLGSSDPCSALFDIAARGGAPTSLKELGMPRDGIEQALDLAFKSPYWNPRRLERAPLRSLLEDAWNGERPRC